MTVCFKRFFAFLTDYREFVILVSHSRFLFMQKSKSYGHNTKRDLNSTVMLVYTFADLFPGYTVTGTFITTTCAADFSFAQLAKGKKSRP